MRPANQIVDVNNAVYDDAQSRFGKRPGACRHQFPNQNRAPWLVFICPWTKLVRNYLLSNSASSVIVRREDIPLLVEHFAKAFSVTVGKPINEISAATMRKLCEYSWPGNIRELANVVERGVINSSGPVLRIADQLESLFTSESASTKARTLAEIERDYIMRVLEEAHWRIEGPHGAAEILGLNPSTLRTRMAKFRIRRGTPVMQP